MSLFLHVYYVFSIIALAQIGGQQEQRRSIELQNLFTLLRQSLNLLHHCFDVMAHRSVEESACFEACGVILRCLNTKLNLADPNAPGLLSLFSGDGSGFHFRFIGSKVLPLNTQFFSNANRTSRSLHFINFQS